MNNIIGLSETIRTIASDKLLKNISLKRMHYYLMDLFHDRTNIDTSIFGRFADEDTKKHAKYTDCLNFNCGFDSESKHNLFVPFDDGGNE